MTKSLDLQQRQVAAWGMTSHQRLAIKAAMQGNWRPADTLELQWFVQKLSRHDGNCAPMCQWCTLRNLIGRPHQMEGQILRNAAPDAADVVEFAGRSKGRYWRGIATLDGHLIEFEEE